MTLAADQLYALLPSIYRIRDQEEGEPLKAFLAVLAEQVEVLQEDLSQLYDDQFIETCAEWVVPYLGDLIGYRRLQGATSPDGSSRAEVANTIAYRRRKGTVSMVEQLATDVTGWKARAVEFFQQVCTTQYLNHIRPTHHAVADLRRQRQVMWSQTPFNSMPRTVDVRWIATGRGRYNLPNVGLFLWRLRPYRVAKGTAKLVKEGCFTFHPLGSDMPLFNPGQGEESLARLAEPVNVPDPLRRRSLFDELEELRQSLADGRAEAAAVRALSWFDRRQPVLQVFKNGTAVPAKEILICDLTDWQRPPSRRTYRRRGKRPGDATPDPQLPIQVAVDPVLGRLAFPADANLTGIQVEVTYSFGFSGDFGGGPYLTDALRAPVTRRVAAGGSTLAQALTAVGTADAVIQIEDNATIDGDLTITLGPDQDLTIQGHEGARPVLTGTITIVSAKDAELTLHNLMLAKSVRMTGTADTTLTIRHCTLAPVELAQDLSMKPRPEASVRWVDAGSRGTLVVDHTLSGRLLTSPDVSVELFDSAVDALADTEVALAAADDGTVAAGELRLVRTTIIGAIRVRALELAEHTLVTGTVISEQQQHGCVRFSYLPSDSRVPRQYRCQPEWAAQRARDAAQQRDPSVGPDVLAQLETRIRSSLRPLFTTSRFGQPAYLQLHASCPVEIRTGAENGSEMGLFQSLGQAQREANLRARMEEYLRFGLESGIFYVT
ncbi:MAG TPA: phage tail protein [Nitrospiraceae bacterium]|nr:phage tail protein [Nitrospiraceae bacterium]